MTELYEKTVEQLYKDLAKLGERIVWMASRGSAYSTAYNQCIELSEEIRLILEERQVMEEYDEWLKEDVSTIIGEDHLPEDPDYIPLKLKDLKK